MRVLYLTHRVPYAPNRGDRIRAYHTLRYLRSVGVPVCLVAFAHDDEESDEAPSLRELCDESHVLHLPRFINLLRAVPALAGPRPLTHVLLNSRRMRPLLSRICDTWQPDVVLAYCSGMAQFAMQPPLDRLPFVLDMVDVDSAKWQELAERDPWPWRLVEQREARLLASFEAAAARAANHTLVVAQRERAALERISPGARVSVMTNGIDAAYFRPPQEVPRRTDSVVFTGVFDYAPNAEGALWLVRHVWPRVLQSYPDAKLFLVGRAPSRALQAAASRNASILVTGSVPDVRPYLWKSKVAVAPIFVAKGMQNKVLEAVAAGLRPVITSAVAAGLPDSIRACCRVATEPVPYADAIVEAMRLNSDTGRCDTTGLAWSDALTSLRPLLEDAAGLRGTARRCAH